MNQGVAIAIVVLIAAALGVVVVLVATGKDTNSDKIGSQPAGTQLNDGIDASEDDEAFAREFAQQREQHETLARQLGIAFPGAMRVGTRWVMEYRSHDDELIQLLYYYCAGRGTTDTDAMVIRTRTLHGGPPPDGNTDPTEVEGDNAAASPRTGPREILLPRPWPPPGTAPFPDVDPGEDGPLTSSIVMHSHSYFGSLHGFVTRVGGERGVEERTIEAAGRSFDCVVLQLTGSGGDMTAYLSKEYPNLWVRVADKTGVRQLIRFDPGPEPQQPE